MYLIITWMNVPITSMSVVRTDQSNGAVLATAKSAVHDKYGRWVVEWNGDGGAGYYRFTLGAKNRTTTMDDFVYWNGLVGYQARGVVNFPVRGQRTNVVNWPLP